MDRTSELGTLRGGGFRPRVSRPEKERKVVQISGKIHEDPGRRAAQEVGVKRCHECSNRNHRSLGSRLKVCSEIAG
jgi:hypothetical protein